MLIAKKNEVKKEIKSTTNNVMELDSPVIKQNDAKKPAAIVQRE